MSTQAAAIMEYADVSYSPHEYTEEELYAKFDKFQTFIAEVKLEDMMMPDNEGSRLDADEFIRRDFQNREALCSIMDNIMDAVTHLPCNSSRMKK